MKRPFVAALLLIGMLAAPVVYVHTAPERVLEYEFARQAWWGNVAKTSVQAGDTTWSYYEGGSGPETLVLVTADHSQAAQLVPETSWLAGANAASPGYWRFAAAPRRWTWTARWTWSPTPRPRASC